MVDYKETKNIPITQLNNLFESIGWGSRPVEKWERAVQASSFVASAWNGDELIGLGRVLEDGVMCMLYDIGVHPEYQGEGIGSAIMNMLVDYVKDKEYVSIGLFVWEENPNSAMFYEKFGFEKVSTGMELIKYMVRE